MPQYLVANYLPDDFDAFAVTRRNRSDDRGDPRAQPRNDRCRRQEVRLRNFPGQQRKDGAKAAGWYGARHRWAIHRDQGAHGRFLDTGSCRYGRGAGVGEEGRHRLRCARRSARASFLPGSGGSNGIVWPPRLRNVHRLDYGMNEPARSYAAGSRTNQMRNVIYAINLTLDG